MRATLPTSPWFICPRPDLLAPLRLWCLPFAGGGAAVWHPWAKPLTGLAEVVGIRAPGRESRFAEAPLLHLPEMVRLVVDHIGPHLGEPYALCGHSLGGLACFEIARTLRARNLPPPRALVVCGARAPHYPPDRPLIHPMAVPEFMAEVQRRYGEIPAAIRDHPDFLSLLLPILRADLQVYETYEHVASAPLDTPLLALGGTADHIVSHPQLLDWREHTTGQFELDQLPGGHFFPQENVTATTARVRTFLTAILRQPPLGRSPAVPAPNGVPREDASSVPVG